MKGNRFTYMTNKLMIFVMFIETEMQINWVGVVFNNLHNRLRDLGGLIKSNVTKGVELNIT